MSDSVRFEAAHKRIRVYFAGHPVADTVNPVMVWERPYYPTYYLPAGDVRSELLRPTGHTRGDAELYTLRVGEREAVDAVSRFPQSPVEQLRGLVRLDWAAMDAWFEEDE